MRKNYGNGNETFCGKFMDCKNNRTKNIRINHEVKIIFK